MFKKFASKQGITRGAGSNDALPTVKDLESIKFLSGWLYAGKTSSKVFVVVTLDQKLYIFKDLNTPARSLHALKQYSEVVEGEKYPEKSFIIRSTCGRNDLAFQCEDENEKGRWKNMISSLLKNLLDDATVAEHLRTMQISERSKSSSISKWRVLYVKVIEARNLPAMDISGTSDPFCYITCGHEQRRTLTIWENNKNPLWAEEFELEIVKDPSDLNLIVEVLDEDLLTNDDNIGKVVIPLSTFTNQQVVEKWYPLATPDKEFVSGDVRLQITRRETEVKVKLVEARNLAPKDPNGLSDPFVRIHHGKQKKKTKTVKKNLNPIYDEEFTFKIEPNSPLKITVWDWDLVGTNDYMGEFLVDFRAFPLNVIVDEWYTLTCGGEVESSNNTNTEDSLGDIKLKIQYKEELVLPSGAYQNLSNFLLNNMEVIIAYSDDVVLEKADFAKVLVNIFDVHNRALKLIEELTRFEISSTLNPDVIFRGNTVVTKSIDYFMKIAGMTFLQKVLTPFVSDVIKNYSKTSIEIDPSKADKGEDIKKNVKRLSALCNSLLDNIFSSIDDFPPIMRGVFSNIRQQVTSKYLANQIGTVKYTAVSGFLFLRYFGPAILNPRLFGLLNELPTQTASRAFTLVAKVVQNLANLVEFGDKEPFMKDLNPFILQNIDRMKGYIDTVSVTTGVVPQNTGDASLWEEKELAVCTWYLSSYREKLYNKFPNFAHKEELNRILADLEVKRNQYRANNNNRNC